MKVKIAIFVIGILLTQMLQGCSFGTASKDKVQDLKYTVVPKEDVPKELAKIIEGKKEQSFQLSYAAGDDLYIAIGYGKQETGGYSITMEELYVTADAIVIAATLMGPKKDEAIEKTPTCPYIVVKTEYLDLPVEYLGVENGFIE